MDIVKVNSIGNERKKYRIQVGISSNQLVNQGNWSFRLPPIQDLNNSGHYNQCLIKFTKIIINPMNDGIPGLNPQDNQEPCWVFNNAQRGVTAPCVLMHFSIPCPQQAVSRTDSIALNGGSGLGGDPAITNRLPYHTDNMHRLTELVPCNWIFRQNFSGSGDTDIRGPAAAAPVFGNARAIMYINTGADEGLLSANPFGANIDVFISDPIDQDNTRIYLSNDAAAGLDRNGIPAIIAAGGFAFKDITEIYLEFYVEMVENK